MNAQYGIAIDQWGNKFRFGKHCRKDLMDQIGRKHVAKMYQHKKDGRVVQVGYVIGRHWLTVYTPVEIES